MAENDIVKVGVGLNNLKRRKVTPKQKKGSHGNRENAPFQVDT